MKIKNKKGMAINTIVMLIIALIVLVIILFIFKDQITKALGGYSRIQKETGETLEERKCRTIIGDRDCHKIDDETKSCPSGKRKVAGDWQDCASDKPICCEDVY